MLETFVVGELRKQLSWAAPHTSLYHFRTSSGSEVDVVLEQADGSVAGVDQMQFGGLDQALAHVC